MTNRLSGRVPEVPTECVAPTRRSRRCRNAPVAGAPFPLCVHHLAEAWRFAHERMTQAKAGRSGAEQRHLPPPPDLITAAKDAATERPGVVYYLRVGALIKIGVTWDLDQRLRAYPPDVEVLATEPGGTATEQARLAQFREHLAYPARPEWFHPADELMAHIAGIAG